MQDASTLPPIPNDLATCQQMIGELLATLKQLRATLDKQNSHIDYLVRMTFGRRSERFEGPTLFDAFSPPEPPTPPAEPEPEATVVVKRKGHGRRRSPIAFGKFASPGVEVGISQMVPRAISADGQSGLVPAGHGLSPKLFEPGVSCLGHDDCLLVLGASHQM